MEADDVKYSRTRKVNDFVIKDIRMDYDSLSKHVDDFVSSISKAIDAIPEGFKRSPEELKKLMVDFEPTKCFIEVLILCGCLQEEFGTLKIWYDHIGGDVIGLTWTKHNSRKRERDEEEEVETNPIEMLKIVGKTGKGLV